MYAVAAVFGRLLGTHEKGEVMSRKGCSKCREERAKRDPVQAALETVSMVCDQSFSQNIQMGVLKHTFRSSYWWWRMLQ